eukprot:XP_008653977.1 uncharacterized protein LOC103634163 [Zea mays]
MNAISLLSIFRCKGCDGLYSGSCPMLVVAEDGKATTVSASLLLRNCGSGSTLGIGVEGVENEGPGLAVAAHLFSLSLYVRPRRPESSLSACAATGTVPALPCISRPPVVLPFILLSPKQSYGPFAADHVLGCSYLQISQTEAARQASSGTIRLLKMERVLLEEDEEDRLLRKLGNTID